MTTTLPLRSISLAAEARGPDAAFPFTIPALQGLETLALKSPVTFLVGENGSGKSTFLEALAWAAESVTVGAFDVGSDASLEHVRPLGRALRLSWGRRTRRGLFLRAEDFFGYVRRVNRSLAGLDADAAQVRAENPDLPEGELDRIAAPFEGSAAALRARHGEDADARSHGEQFLAFFRERLVPAGLYLLDEPEAPLSPAHQLALIALLKEATEAGSQFVIATHSPILMAFPGAVLWSFDHAPAQEAAYEDLEHVTLTRDFLNRPEAYLRHL
jgi:predicted ATPase